MPTPFKTGVRLNVKNKGEKPYLRVSAGQHRGQYVHVMIVEALLGRRLRPDETVDHRNGDTLDNRTWGFDWQVDNALAVDGRWIGTRDSGSMIWGNLRVVSREEHARLTVLRAVKEREEKERRGEDERSSAGTRTEQESGEVAAGSNSVDLG